MKLLSVSNRLSLTPSSLTWSRALQVINWAGANQRKRVTPVLGACWRGFIQDAMLSRRMLDLDELKAMFDDAKVAHTKTSDLEPLT